MLLFVTWSPCCCLNVYVDNLIIPPLYSLLYSKYLGTINLGKLGETCQFSQIPLDRVHNAKIDLWELLANIPHILSPVPNRKDKLGTNLHQLLVVEICRNTCKSHEKTLQLLQNHSVSHYTDSQRSSISFLRFWVICASITIVGFQRSHNPGDILEIFFTFLSLELKVTKTTKPTGSNMTVTIKLLPYTVLLNFKIVWHLAELNSIKHYNKTSGFFCYILATVDNYQ